VAPDGDRKTRKLALSPHDTLATAAARAFAAVLDALGQYAELAAGGDVEGLHQMRVATRRLRATIDLLAPVLHATQRRTLERELSWLGAAGGTVRELDVITDLLARRAAKVDPKLAESMAQLRDALVERRAEELEKMGELLRSARYHALLRRLARPAVRKTGAEAEIAPMAARLVRPMVQSVHRAGARLREDSPPEVVHRLRIRIKRLRYAFELLGTLGGKSHKKALRRLEELQDLLGAFNDVVVAIDWLIAYGQSSGVSAQTALAAGAMAQSLIARKRKLARRSVRTWRKFERSAIIRGTLEELRSSARAAEAPAPPAASAA
jgi:triphosphatase